MGLVDHLPQCRLHTLHRAPAEVADERQVADDRLGAFLSAGVARQRADLRDGTGESGNGRRVGAAVVVEDDEDAAVAVAQVVEGFVRHAPGHRAVADHRDDVPVRLAGCLHGLGQAVGVAEHRRCVTVLDPVVLALASVGVAREPARLTQSGETRGSARDDLVHVRLVPGVPQQDVVRRTEHAMQREGQLDHAQVRSEVTGVHARGAHDEVPHFHRQTFKLGIGEASEVVG